MVDLKTQSIGSQNNYSGFYKENKGKESWEDLEKTVTVENGINVESPMRLFDFPSENKNTVRNTRNMSNG